MKGIPVVIVEKGGFPVKAVTSRAPVMTVVDNGKGAPVVLSDSGAPFIVQNLP